MKRSPLIAISALLAAGALWFTLHVRISDPPYVAQSLDANKQHHTSSLQIQSTKERGPNSVRAAGIGGLAPRYLAIEPSEFDVVVLPPIEPVADTWNETYNLLIDEARSGDTDAQYHLARAAQVCFHNPADEEAEKWLDKATAPYYDGIGNFVESNSQTHPNANARDRLLTVSAFCRGSSRKETARFPEWLEMAASAGNPRAMVNYAVEFPGDDDLDPTNNDADLQLIERRKATYRGYLQEAIELGSIDAMLQLAFIRLYADPQKNREEAFSYLYAYAWYRLRNEGSDASLKAIDWLGNQMSPHEYNKAVDKGKRILQSKNCCFKIPENK